MQQQDAAVWGTPYTIIHPWSASFVLGITKDVPHFSINLNHPFGSCPFASSSFSPSSPR